MTAGAKLSPSDDVYSYFLFTMPLEEQKAPGKLTWNKTLAYFNVFLVLFIQSSFLYAIFRVIVLGDLDWQKGIVHLDGLAPGQCNPGGSLCQVRGDLFECGPPSVQLAGRWEELDTNGDGIWTKDEVMAARNDLKCKYVVDPVEVFNVFVKFLLFREKVIWLHPDVKAFKAIHKFYFTYAMGDVVMCGYRNEDMCPNLLRRGIFDGPLQDGTAPRVGTTIDSALEYCYGLLEDGGMCERTLPSTYSVWRKNSADQCGGAGYKPFVYNHPNEEMTKSMLAVDYGAREDYERAGSSTLFLSYQLCVVIIYLLVMFFEFKEVLRFSIFVLKFPSSKDCDEDEAVTKEEDPNDGSERWSINGISTNHRLIMGVITFLRFALVVVALQVGMTFLLADTDYMSLLLNGLGLLFIMEVVKLPHEQLLNAELREKLDSTEPISIPGWEWWGKSHALRDILWVTAMIVLIAVWWTLYMTNIRIPMGRAIQCACLSQGETCHEALKYSDAWWKDYWNVQVPAVFAAVDQLKANTVSLAQADVFRSRPQMLLQVASGAIANASVAEKEAGTVLREVRKHVAPLTPSAVRAHLAKAFRR